MNKLKMCSGCCAYQRCAQAAVSVAERWAVAAAELYGLSWLYDETDATLDAGEFVQLKRVLLLNCPADAELLPQCLLNAEACNTY